MSKGKPFFSVVIPLYNKEKYIKRTLDSILNQTFTDYEIIIVDDGSKDNSCEIVESIGDPRIRLIRQDNGGPSKARNRGIKEAKGQFIAFLDADDEWLPEKLTKQHDLHIKYPDLMWSCAAFKSLGGQKVKTIKYAMDDFIQDALLAIVDGLKIWTSTVVIHKNIFDNKRFLFNESFNRSEDRELWYKLACIFPRIGYIDQITAIYHIQIEGSLTQTALENQDFSFLSMPQRLDVELRLISEQRKNIFLKYLLTLDREYVLVIWRYSRSFKLLSKELEPYIDVHYLEKLRCLTFLPITIRRIISKKCWCSLRKYLLA